MKRVTLCMLSAILLFFFVAASPLHAEQLRVSVAASMTDLFKELIITFGKHHPEITLVSNFGPSGGLAKQINQGAPAHIYLSANPKWMAFLAEQKMIEPSTQKTFAHNTLVFVGRPNQQITSLADIAALQRIGICSPNSSPAGQYAKQALDRSGLYGRLLAAGKLVMAKDVRQALIYADRGETGGSFVYKTDARLAQHAKVLFEVDPQLHNRVTYPVAITVMGAGRPDVKLFFDFITSAAVKETLTNYGFSLPE